MAISRVLVSMLSFVRKVLEPSLELFILQKQLVPFLLQTDLLSQDQFNVLCELVSRQLTQFESLGCVLKLFDGLYHLFYQWCLRLYMIWSRNLYILQNEIFNYVLKTK